MFGVRFLMWFPAFTWQERKLRWAYLFSCRWLCSCCWCLRFYRRRHWFYLWLPNISCSRFWWTVCQSWQLLLLLTGTSEDLERIKCPTGLELSSSSIFRCCFSFVDRRKHAWDGWWICLTSECITTLIILTDKGKRWVRLLLLLIILKKVIRLVNRETLTSLKNPRHVFLLQDIIITNNIISITCISFPKSLHSIFITSQMDTAIKTTLTVITTLVMLLSLLVCLLLIFIILLMIFSIEITLFWAITAVGLLVLLLQVISWMSVQEVRHVILLKKMTQWTHCTWLRKPIERQKPLSS